MRADVIKMGKRGTVVIPTLLRQRFGFHDGDLVITEDHGDGVLIRPAVAVPVEHYTLERQAEFLLSNAVDAKDYERAKKAVKKLGLDPAAVLHRKPIKGKG
jgi:AbrB family looped-hinge helix DNA binding protein